jgi:PAS domain S-box-containing protein
MYYTINLIIIDTNYHKILKGKYMDNTHHEIKIAGKKFSKTEEEVDKSKKSEAFLANILENSSQPFGVGYPDGQLGLVNRAFEELTGYSRDELKNINWSKTLTPPEFNDMENKKLEELQRTGNPVKYEKEYIRKDGSRVPIELLVHIVKNDNGTPEYYYSFIRDITERKRAEKERQEFLNNERQIKKELQTSYEELRQSLEQLYTIYELNPNAIVLTTLSDSRIIDCNQEYLNQIGYTREEVIGHTSLELNLITPDNRKAYIGKTRGSSKISNYELKVRRKDGSFIDVSYSARYITFNKEQVILNIGHDITERKKSEQQKQELLENEQQLTEELRITNEELMHQGNELLKINNRLEESEERFRALADNIPNLAWMAEPNGWIFWYNTRWYEYTGTTLEEMQGWGWKKVHHPDYLQSVTEEWSTKIKEGKPYDNIFPLKGKDGNYRWFLTRVTPIKDKHGEIQRWFGTNTDVTELKEAQERNQKLLENEQLLTEELQTSNEELQSTTEELNVSNEELREQEGKLVQINKELQISEKSYRNIIENLQNAYIQADREGIVTLASPSASRMFRFDSTEEMLGISATSFYKNKEDRILMLENLNKYGKVEDFKIEGLRNDGTSFHASLNSQYHYDDKGQIQGTESFIRDITQQQKSEEEIERTMTKLKRSNKELERFAYVSSHDLQEPLRMVALYSQLLERRYKDKLDEDANDFIEYIVDGAQRMRQLIDDLLQYSRISSQSREFEEVNLDKVLDIVLKNLSILIVENNGTVNHDPLPNVFADQNQMLQVFQNLITNAIKFHGQNPPEIDISTHKKGDIWTFSVKDNGIGIEPKHQKQIFEVFKRLHHDREKYPGSGIGLSITQKIITRHGGKIWVESELGRGSTFYFTIPENKNILEPSNL